jgi:hypothetical protein
VLLARNLDEWKGTTPSADSRMTTSGQRLIELACFGRIRVSNEKRASLVSQPYSTAKSRDTGRLFLTDLECR